MIHYVKSEEPMFSQVVKGNKTYELRVNDRNYREGDYICQAKYDAVVGEFLGGVVVHRIGFCSKDYPALAPGFVCLSLLPLSESEIEIAEIDLQWHLKCLQ